MSPAEISLALFSVLCSTSGQISLKAATKWRGKISMLFLCAGGGMMLLAILAAALVLRTLPLSLLVPFSGLAYITVPCAAMIIFRETIQPVFWLGTILIVVGIILTLL